MGTALPTLKLTYFDIEGVAECIRLALIIKDIPFEDERITYKDWEKLKATTPFGKLPLLKVNDKEWMAQSGCILRYCGRLPKGPTLYPDEIQKMISIEQVLGLAGDFERSFSVCVYLNMSPQTYGYPQDFNKTTEGQQKVKAAREEFIASKLPEFMGYYSRLLRDSQYFCGDQMTIADLKILPQLRMFQKGHLDYIPTDCLNQYPIVTSWMTRMLNHPKIYKHYAPAASLRQEERNERGERAERAA